MSHENANAQVIRSVWSNYFCEKVESIVLPRMQRRDRALDFGCGHFETGLRLLRSFGQVDGLDVDEDAIANARTRARNVEKTRLVSSVDDLETDAYDFIAVCSVVQYLRDPGEFVDLMRTIRRLLKPSPGSTIVLADLVPRNYSAARDGLDSLRFAAREGFLLAMVRHLGLAATSGNPGRFLAVEPETVVSLAREGGLASARQDQNFTPSRERYTYVLTLA